MKELAQFKAFTRKNFLKIKIRRRKDLMILKTEEAIRFNTLRQGSYIALSSFFLIYFNFFVCMGEA